MTNTNMRLLISISILIFINIQILRIDSAPRPPLIHQSASSSSIPGASENEIEENVLEIRDDDKVEKEMDDLGLEYGRYLQEIVKALDEDPVFSKKLENVTHEQIMNGHVARIIDQVAPDVRNRLDELKRIEIDRLRKLAMKEHKLEEEIEREKQQQNGDGAYDHYNDLESGRRWRTTTNNQKIQIPSKLLDEGNAAHVDHSNPHTFEAEDLQRLILKATKDLDELDKKRRRNFKQYEMEKELHYRESLQNMTAEQKVEAEKKHEEIKQKHREHPKVHHPGSKQQLEQVWEEQDHMPKQEFDPKVFFQMHDLNGDGFLDQEEVEAILTVEVKKLYNEKDSTYDKNEMMEEYHRMREHIYKEIDVNRDGLISKKEFLDYTKQEEFNKDDGWKGIEEAPVYTEEELRRYEKERLMLQEHYAKYGAYGYPPQQQPGMPQYQPVYYQVANPQQGRPGQEHHQVYVVNAPPEHIQQPVQYHHVELPPQHYQHPMPPQHQQQQIPQQQHPQLVQQQQQPPPQQQYHQQVPPNQQQQQYHQQVPSNQPQQYHQQVPSNQPPQQQQHPQQYGQPNQPQVQNQQPPPVQYQAQPVQHQQMPNQPPPPPQQQQQQQQQQYHAPSQVQHGVPQGAPQQHPQQGNVQQPQQSVHANNQYGGANAHQANSNQHH